MTHAAEEDGCSARDAGQRQRLARLPSRPPAQPVHHARLCGAPLGVVPVQREHAHVPAMPQW